MRAALIAALLAAVLAAAGCGGSSSSATATTDTSATTESTSTDTTSTTEDTTSSTDTTGGSGITDATGLSAGCKKVAALSTEFGKALAAAGATGSGEGADLQKTASAYESFAANAPEEIRAAFQTVADAFGKYAEALQGVDLSSGQTPDAGTIAKLAKAAKELDNTKLTAANEQISTWVQDNCSAGS